MIKQTRSSLILISLLLSLLIHVQVQLQFTSFANGDDPALSAWASVPPTIDGVIDEEWAPAASVAYTTTGGVDGVFYVMNDVVNLYIAVVTSDFEIIPGIIDDRVYVYFDNDHDGVGPEAGDDIIGWHELEFFKDCFSDGTYVLKRDTDFGGTSDGSAVATNNGTHNHFEFMHPLDTVDDAHDFSIFMGDTVGFAIRLIVDGVDKGWWPLNDPSVWFDITVFKPVLSAWTSNTPMIDGKLNPSYELLGRWYPAEWRYADKTDFVLSWGAESHNASLYVMNDYINLYLAFEIKNEEHNFDDMVIFNFDNDNDGIKWSGDDQLSVNGSILYEQNLGGQFEDAFFPTPGEGPSQRDADHIIHLKDGVGAAQFTGTKNNGSYVFELAHPLNTSDDLHDFSLGVEDTVGFNVLYLDAGGGVGSEAGWPTFTLGEWKEMAEITIASPEFVIPEPRLNLKISKIEVTQAIQWLDDVGVVPHAGPDNSLPLAEGKSTAVRVYVDIGRPTGPSVSVDVYLYATNILGTSLVQPHRGDPYGPLRESFRAPVIPDRGNENHTANFLLPDYWVMEPIFLVAFVQASSLVQSETNYTDNWMEWQQTLFTMTKSLEIGYYLVNYRLTWPPLGPAPNVPSQDKIRNGKDFFEKVTPMPDLSNPVIYYPLAGSPLYWDKANFTQPSSNAKGWDDNRTAQRELLGTLLEMRDDMLIMCGEAPDQIVGLYTNAITRTGRVWSIPGTVFIAHENRPWSFAHEIGHNYGFDHSWDDGGVHGPNPWNGTIATNSSQTYGYDTQANWAPNEPEDIVKIPASNDTENNTKYGALMSYYDEYRWISPWEWERLIEEFNPGEAAGLSESTLTEDQSSSPGLRISGVIYKNNTGNLRPIFQTPSFLDVEIPSGPYIVELRGSPPTEPLYYSQSFNVSFEEGDDRTLFMLNVPFITGTYSVSLWNATISPPVLLDKISASSNPPSVTVTYPNGGETVGDSFNVTWVASDLDGDQLMFKLFHSNDNGATWLPLSPRIRETSYHVDTSTLPGSSQSIIRIQVSDGFHTSEDQSDTVFNMPLKSPLNVAGIGIGPCMTYNFGETVILKGSAFDPEDGVLNGTALTWTSDLNGTLGTGKVLPVTDLVPGTHNITLTATDSNGNNLTDSFTVTVELHNVAVTNAIPQKSIIGEGYSLYTNVTVENQGLQLEKFNVTIYATTTLSGNVINTTYGETVTDVLGSNSLAVITMTWNTSLCTKGNYTISVIAWDVIGEVDITDNIFTDSIVLVTFRGDVNGDLKVRVDDILAIALAFGSNLGDPDYDPNLDVNGDDKIRVDDILIAALNFGLG